MKNGLILMILLAGLCFAQEETLLGGDDVDFGGFGGPVWKVGMINGKAGVFSGGRGGLIINHSFIIGGGGYSSMSDIKTDMTAEGTDKPIYLNMYYGGLEMEYIGRPGRLFHYNFMVLLGPGTVNLVTHEPNEEYANSKFFVIEPGVNAELNVSSWMRVGIGAGYRIIFGTDLPDLTDEDMSGISAALTLKFGSF
ncbi:hypothetical protein JW935_08210 [candidate division KSB1 bacterium]|nr:hypothetical protein [candidate division KSB1 bacterium]